MTDIAYWRTSNVMRATASTWLVGAGVVMGLVAALFGFTDFFGSRQIRALPAVWHHMIGNLLAVIFSAVNLLVHFRDGAGGVATGLALSLVVVLILLYTGWMGWEMVYRHKVGVSE